MTASHKGYVEPRTTTLSTLARSLGATAGFVRRRLAGSRRNRDVARTDMTEAFGVGPLPNEAALRRRERFLEVEVEVLQNELTQLYNRIGTLSEADATSVRAIHLLREAKEEHQAKRLELTKLRRHLARERRLHDMTSLQTESPKRRAASKKSEVQRRRQVERTLESVPDRGAEPLVLRRVARCLLDDDAAIRREALRDLRSVRSDRAIDLLLVALDDPHLSVRVTALNTVAERPGVRASRVLRRFLKDAEPQLRQAAVRGLAARRGELSNAELMTALEDPAPTVRRTAALLLGWREADEAVSPLVFSLGDSNSEVRATAAESLCNLRSERAVRPLLGVLDDESPAARTMIERALRALIGPEFDSVGKGLPPAERIEALKAWWETARVDRLLHPREARAATPHAEPPVGAPVREQWEKITRSAVLPTPSHESEAAALGPTGELDRPEDSVAESESVIGAEAEAEGVIGAEVAEAEAAIGIGVTDAEADGDFMDVFGGDEAEGIGEGGLDEEAEGGDFLPLLGDEEGAEGDDAEAYESLLGDEDSGLDQ